MNFGLHNRMLPPGHCSGGDMMMLWPVLCSCACKTCLNTTDVKFMLVSEIFFLGSPHFANTRLAALSRSSGVTVDLLYNRKLTVVICNAQKCFIFNKTKIAPPTTSQGLHGSLCGIVFLCGCVCSHSKHVAH